MISASIEECDFSRLEEMVARSAQLDIQDDIPSFLDGFLSERRSPKELNRIFEIFAKAGEVNALSSAVVRALPAYPDEFPLWGLMWRPGVPAGLRDEAVSLALEIMERNERIAVPVTIAAVQRLRWAQCDDAELERAKTLRDSVIDSRSDADFWRARAALADGDPEAALGWIESYLSEKPGEARAIVLRGTIAVRTGKWGEMADAINPLSDYPENAEAKENIDQVQSFLKAHGTDLTIAASKPAEYAHLSTPASVFEHVVRNCPVARPTTEHRGLFMVCGSLAAGGAERVVATIFSHLSQDSFRNNIELWLFSRGHSGSMDHDFFASLLGPHSDRVFTLGTPDRIQEPFRWLPQFYAQKAQAIHDQLVVSRPSVVHASLDQAILPTAIAALVAGVPRIVLHCHNMSPPSLYPKEITVGWSRAYAALLSRPEVYLLNVSKSGLDDYMRWMGREPTDRTLRLFNGFDFSDFAEGDRELIDEIRTELGIPKGAMVIGTALRFTDVKRPRRWIETAKRILKQQPDSHFVLYGQGSLLKDTRAYARSLGILDKVHFPGRVSDLNRRLALFDVFMLSSRSEGLPNVLIEAQAAGVIPVTYDVGGCAETMVDGETGILVREDSAQALAEAVCFALGDKAWRRRASQRGRKFVRETFSTERMVNSIQTILQAKTLEGPSNWNGQVEEGDCRSATANPIRVIWRCLRRIVRRNSV